MAMFCFNLTGEHEVRYMIVEVAKCNLFFELISWDIMTPKQRARTILILIGKIMNNFINIF